MLGMGGVVKICISLMVMEWLSGRVREEVPCNVVKLAEDSQNNMNDAPLVCCIITGGRKSVFWKAVKLILIVSTPGKQQLK